jgi:anti-anti-sigma regulatory factor
MVWTQGRDCYFFGCRDQGLERITERMTDRNLYIIDEIDDDQAVIKFADKCDFPVLKEDEEVIDRLLSEKDTVGFDLSATTAIGSVWVRLLALKTRVAKDSGKRFICIGMSDEVGAVADIIGIRDGLDFGEMPPRESS